MSPLDCPAQHTQLAVGLPTLENLVEDSQTIDAPREVALAVEKAQLPPVDVHVVVQDLMAEEVESATEIMKTPTLAPIEALHLETQKKPSNSTYSTQSER